eukprot:87774_1
MSTNSTHIWTKEPGQVSCNEYKDLFRSLTCQNGEYLAKQHFSIEGQIELNAILFIPHISTTFSFDKSKLASQKTKYLVFGFIQSNEHSLNLTIPPLIFHIILAYYFEHTDNNGTIRLYSRNVLLEDPDNEYRKQLLPDYLHFIYGIVNSQDITRLKYCEAYPTKKYCEAYPTNNKILKLIRKNNVKKIILLLTEMSENDKNRYNLFYKHYAKHIKLGIIEDRKNSKKLANLLRFYSNKTGCDEQKSQMISLKEYINRMKIDKNNKIYYIETAMIKHKKYKKLLQKFDERNLEILYLIDISLAEYTMRQLIEYDGFRFMNVMKEDPNNLPLTEKERIAWNKQKRLFEPVCEKMKYILGDNVGSITVTDCYNETSACSLLTDSGWSAGMIRILQAQALRDETVNVSNFIVSAKTLEINPNHKIMKYLKKKINLDKNMDKMSIDIIWLLFEGERVRSGYGLYDAVEFKSKLYDLMRCALEKPSCAK